MAKLINKLKRIRLVFRRSSTLTKTVVLSAVALSMVALLTMHFTISATQRKTRELAEQAARLEQENSKLEDNIDGLGSAEGVEQIAKDELGLVNPDTVIIQPGK